MRRSSPTVLSLSTPLTTSFSTLILFLLLCSFFALPEAFAQGRSQKMRPAPLGDFDEDQPQKRAEWNMHGREAPKGQSAAALRLRAHQQKMAMRAQRAATSKTEASGLGNIPQGWLNLGPAPLLSDTSLFGTVSGRSTAVAIDPSDATGNTVYVAAASGGVWKSTNAADAVAANVTWTPVTDQESSLTSGAVSVKPDGTVVLVGTGEPNNAIDSYYGVGVLRSTDKGATWSLISSGDSGAHPFAGLGFNKFAWVPASNTVVAATATAAKGFEEGLIGSNTNRGLYLSTNAGQTWAYQAPTDGSTPISVTDVMYNAKAGKFFAAIRYHGVYSSTSGTNWTRLTNQPNPTVLSTANCPVAVNGNNPCPMYRGQFAVVPGRNEMYFWFIDASLQDQGIWQSLDGGTSWKQLQPASQCTLDPDTSNPPCGMKQPFYNLELGAMPNGTGTDLYAGLVNLYKCRVNTGTQSCATIDSSLPNSWINLTQVYSCPSISGVHPDEHGFDFAMVGGKAITYFGNDGGIYRTLDALTKLNSGSCGVANQFDNLNANIGSMTQFVSFSVHPTDKDTIIGGTQDNGSPATTTATTSSQFFTALGGDGGYNAIDPTTPTNWYSAFTDVEIGVCSTAPACNDNAYALVADSTFVAGDVGSFYTPYILDPQNSGTMLIGTCRLWRGPVSTGIFTALSTDFDGSFPPCGGYLAGENDMVRGIAAGGPKDANGLSNVVYATTEGGGPNAGAGGHVFVTTNAATTQMSDITGSINPSNYVISSVAMDNSDATGKTAYVGIMGFNVGSNTAHVWKTTTAGASGWTNWTGSGATAMPDAPVNALLVDSSVTPSQIYAGTDVGIFVSSTSSPSWTEVGPAPGSGQAGYLPNVPVSAIRIFNFGLVKKLRASTYGRGIWEYSLPPNQDFTVPGTLTAPSAAHPGQSTSTTMLISPVGGGTFTNKVTYTCSGLPTGATCSFSPTQISPPASATTVTITVQTAGPFTGTAGSARPSLRSQKQPLWLPLSLPLAGMFLVGVAGRGLPRRYKIVSLCLALALAGVLVACGGGGGSSVPPPPVVTVTPQTVNTLYPNLSGAPAQTQQFSATVSNTTSQAVTWAVTGGSANGSIDSTGLYTAPVALPTPNSAITITATSAAASTPGSARVNLQTPTPTGTSSITVTVTEGSVQHTTTFNLQVL